MKLFTQSRKFFTLLVVCAAVSVWWLALASRSPSHDGTIVRVTITKGSTARQIATVLREARVIRSEAAFVLTCRLSGVGSRLKPGVYGISRNTALPGIIRTLVMGESLERWVTIPEGYTIRQIADELMVKQFVDSDAFVRVAVTQGYVFPRFPFVQGHNLEGFLFPDTYLFERGMEPKDIISRMLDTFEAKVLREHKGQIEAVARARFSAGTGDLDSGIYKVLILASLVEREARIADDRPKIAAVLWNRLERNMRLEICATVSYIPGESRENKSKVSIADTKVDTPYNTYIHPGLPPTPICNPGLASILAVLEPAKVDYLYYVAKPDGSHIFSRTFAEHVDAKHQIANGR